MKKNKKNQSKLYYQKLINKKIYKHNSSKNKWKQKTN